MTTLQHAPTVPGPEQVRPGPLLRLPASLGGFLVLFWLACTFVGAAWWLSDDHGFWFLAGSLAALIVTTPLLQRDYEVISPWTLVVVVVYLACAVRGLFMSLQVDGTRTLDELYFLGQTVSAYYRPTLLFLIALTLFTVGYRIAAPRRAPRKPLFGARPHMAGGRVTLAVVACAAAGFLSFYFFAQGTGGLSLSNLSSKRTTGGVELSVEYQSHGELRALAGLSPIALWLQLAYYNYRGMRHGLTSPRGWWLAALFANSALLPFYSSSRADIVYVILGALVVEYCLGNGKLRLRPLLAAAALVMIIAAAITSLRSADDRSVQSVRVDQAALVDTFVLTRTFADIATSGNVINAVPDRLPYAEGATIAAWFVAPVPRSIWPEKPVISSGPAIGYAIYGNTNSGVPPGMVAEAYWNFGLGGVFVLPLFIGMILRRVGEYWRPFAKSSPAAAVMMAAIAVPPGALLMSNSIGSPPYQMLVSMVLLGPVLWFVGVEKDPLVKASAFAARQ